MPLDQPSQSNGYLISPFHKLSVELWNLILTSLHGRLGALETVAGSFEDALGDEAIALAQGRIDDTIVPQLMQVQEEMTAVQAAISLAEDQLAALQNGGVLAENVPLAGATDLFPAGTDAQEAFGLIELALVALSTAKLAVSAKADLATAKAGASDTKWLTPYGAAALIGEIAGDVVFEVFTASGTFTKQADDFLYFVESINAGASGQAVRSPGAVRYIAGGDGGDYIARFVLPSEFGASIAVTVGAGGLPVTAIAVNEQINGNNGGLSSFGTLVRSLRAAKGGAGIANNAPGVNGDWSGGVSGFTLGNSMLGGGAGASSTVSSGGSATTGQPAGTSQTAGNGGAAAHGTASAGTAPGGGGGSAGGGATNAVSGAGARGEVRVYRFKRRKPA